MISQLSTKAERQIPMMIVFQESPKHVQKLQKPFVMQVNWKLTLSHVCLCRQMLSVSLSPVLI